MKFKTLLFLKIVTNLTNLNNSFSNNTFFVHKSNCMKSYKGFKNWCLLFVMEYYEFFENLNSAHNPLAETSIYPILELFDIRLSDSPIVFRAVAVCSIGHSLKSDCNTANVPFADKVYKMLPEDIQQWLSVLLYYFICIRKFQ